MGQLPLMPEQASTVAGQVDLLYYALIALSLLFALPIAGLTVYFAVKYRRGARADRSGQITATLPYELTWTIVPTLMALGVFVWAATLYFRIERPPADALEIYVLGRQWMWEFQHPEGQRELAELHVPLGRPVKLLMTSEDVIHSFYVPAFRVKQDVLPGRYTAIWFQPSKVGEYHLFCAEYCGTDHAVMGGVVYVMEPAAYQAWLGGGAAGGPQAPQTMAAAGEKLFSGLGCSGCHRMDGSGAGPSLVGVFGSPVQLQGGQSAIADEGYVRNSILLPQSQVVAGYQPVMPSFKGQVSESQILQLIAYIKSLGAGQAAPGASQTAQPPP
ncbi:MAG: cytochrome c oxidase subunit II [Kouleothrix sp.]|nr:cytochrome c oxidase subunit II [Kouleothrix sp.]